MDVTLITKEIIFKEKYSHCVQLILMINNSN